MLLLLAAAPLATAGSGAAGATARPQPRGGRDHALLQVSAAAVSRSTPQEEIQFGDTVKLMQQGQPVFVFGKAVLVAPTEADTVPCWNETLQDWVNFKVERADAVGGALGLRSGDALLLRAHTGMQLSVDNHQQVVAKWNNSAKWERFSIERSQGTGPVLSGDSIALWAWSGMKMSIDGNTAVAKWYDRSTLLETFTIVKVVASNAADPTSATNTTAANTTTAAPEDDACADDRSFEMPVVEGETTDGSCSSVEGRSCDDPAFAAFAADLKAACRRSCGLCQ